MRAFLSTALIGFALLSASVQAQFFERFSVRGGVDAAEMSLESQVGEFGLDMRKGALVAGAAESRSLRPGVRLVLEAQYAMRRYQGPVSRGGDSGSGGGEVVVVSTYDIPVSALHYLSVPALLRVGDAEAGSLYFTAGPQLDVLVAGSPGVRRYESVDGPSEIRDGLPDEMRSLGLSGVAGLGLGLVTIGRADLLFELRYGRSLTNLIDSDTRELNRRGLDFSLALAF